MEKEKLESNKLIAEFMGYDAYVFRGHTMFAFEENNHRTLMDLHYHESWDWLMPVVEKIESMGFNVRIEGISCSISRLCEDEVIAGFVCGDRSKKLEIIHSTLIKFIESYYENKNQ